MAAYYAAGKYDLPMGSTLPAMAFTTLAYLLFTRFGRGGLNKGKVRGNEV